MNYCNVMSGAFLPSKERIFRLQLQFFSPCYMGINYCNATPFLYRILSFQYLICNKFVPNGIPEACARLPWQNLTKFGGPTDHVHENLPNIHQSSGEGPFPEGPKIEKIQSREAILKKSSFQNEMTFSIENDFSNPSRSLATEQQGSGLNFSSENVNFKPRTSFPRVGEGLFFFACVRARLILLFDLWALWIAFTRVPAKVPSV